ncbi:tRNA pseudouridine synthase Pus10 isoform X3 [Lepidochelys kempii]|uniref:tRNA pseudouridine synthase Pus10 isoform X3 n=1 Tax=Lepidochelys kempii TaxID=8472 RepID=UPI003C6EAE94
MRKKRPLPPRSPAERWRRARNLPAGTPVSGGTGMRAHAALSGARSSWFPRLQERLPLLAPEDLLRELHEFLEYNKEKEDRFCCEIADPPCKRIRLENMGEGAEDLNQNGALQQTPVADDVNVAMANSTLKVCNVCLGILQEFCETDFVKKSLFEVSVVFAHPETDEDCHFLARVCPDCFKPAKNKQSVFTRMAIIKALDKIKEEDFREHFPCPPSSPKNICAALEIQCTNGAIFVAGRYNKYSRNLPQTPWIIDGERKLESSVEELISEHLMTAFKADSFNFSSSGREDVDVRTLGSGRPFAIELVNPHRIHFTAMEMKELQQKINNSSDKIKVRDLQLVTREAIGHMKEGEEEKTKTYSALIWTDKAIQKEDIALLDDMKELKIDQKTPLRVLHRRPLAVRSRVIHTMKSEYIDDHHFRLHLKTQAGTYIKEFVHGDFGRTKPNIGFLLKRTADILELDVESVDVDWPPTLND